METKGTIRIEEALNYAKSNGCAITKKELAAMLWPKSKPASQEFNMRGLVNGETKKVSPEWIKTICRETGVDANYLFEVAPIDFPHVERPEQAEK